MLYEVITRAIAKALKEKGFRNLDFPEKPKDREINFHDAFEMLIKNNKDNLGWSRITSYNVCYTKLLRAKQPDERIVELDAEQTEAYLRWLETGEGPDPCADAFSK